MQDLNDLYYFAMVVDHGGFAAAERAFPAWRAATPAQRQLALFRLGRACFRPQEIPARLGGRDLLFLFGLERLPRRGVADELYRLDPHQPPSLAGDRPAIGHHGGRAALAGGLFPAGL